MSDAKRSLKVNLEELMEALDNGFDALRYFLDLETGEVGLITEEIYRQLERLLEMTEAETIEVANEAIRNGAVPDGEKEELYTAALVEFGYGSRFIRIPQAASRAGYEDMEAFIETVSVPHLQELLEVAIRGKGAFRRFKDVLIVFPHERERWFQFRDERLRQRALDWLDEEDIKPIPYKHKEAAYEPFTRRHQALLSHLVRGVVLC